MLNNKKSLAIIAITFFATTILIGSSLMQPISAVNSPGSDVTTQVSVGDIHCSLSTMQPSIPVAMNTVYLPQNSGPNLMKTVYVEKEIYNCNVATAVNGRGIPTLMSYQKLVSIYTKVIDATNDDQVQEVMNFKVIECTKDLKGNFITIPNQPIQAACIASEPGTLANVPAISGCTINAEMPIQLNTISPEPTRVKEIEAEKQVYSCALVNNPKSLTTIKEVVIFTKVSETVSADASNPPIITEGSQETFVVGTCEKNIQTGTVLGCESSVPVNHT